MAVGRHAPATKKLHGSVTSDLVDRRAPINDRAELGDFSSGHHARVHIDIVLDNICDFNHDIESQIQYRHQIEKINSDLTRSFRIFYAVGTSVKVYE